MKKLNTIRRFFIDNLFIERNGIRIEISTSKIKNIINNIMKLVEKESFFSVILSKPHSKGVFFSLHFVFSSTSCVNKSVRVNAIANDIEKVIFIS